MEQGCDTASQYLYLVDVAAGGEVGGAGGAGGVNLRGDGRVRVGGLGFWRCLVLSVREERCVDVLLRTWTARRVG